MEMSFLSKTRRYLVIIFQNYQTGELQDSEQFVELSSDADFDVKTDVLKTFYKRCSHVADLPAAGTAFTSHSSRPVAVCVCPWQNGNDPNWLDEVAEEEIGDLLRDAQSERFDTNVVAQQLHSLCDSVENKAACIDVLWLGCDKETLPISEHLPLYGALKRMVLWHGAKVTIGCPGPCTDQWKAWCQVLQGSYLSLEAGLGESPKEPLFWRGAIKIIGSQIMNPKYLCGFELREKQPESCVTVTPAPKEQDISPEPSFLSRELELMQVVQRHTVPSFYLTGATASLLLSSTTGAKEDSKVLLNMLSRDEVCMIVRVKQGSQIQAVEKLTTLAWEEAVDNDAAVMTKPVIGYQVGGTVSLHHFLLCAGDEPGTYTAYLLYPPSRLNGQIAHTLAMYGYEGRPYKVAAADGASILKDIPHFDGDDLFKKSDDLSRLQVEVLQELKKWKEETTGESEVSVLEIKHILTLVNSEFLSELKKLHRHVEHKVFPLRENIQPEYLLERADCAELESLRIKEALMKMAETARRKRLSKERSSDSFSVLSPPPVEPVGDSHMDVMALLKHFNPDGTAVNKKLAPVQRQPKTKGSPLLKKFDSGDSVAAAWPDSYRCHYHDMYYNTGPKAEKLQAVCHKLNWHIATLETSTSCGSRLGRKTQPRRLSLPKDLSCVTADPNETSTLVSAKSRSSLGGAGSRKNGKGTSKKSPPSMKRKLPQESDQLSKRNTRGAVTALQKKKESLARAANQSKKSGPDTDRKDKQQPERAGPAKDDTNSKTSSSSRRSERHRKMLEDVIKEVLKEANVTKYDKIFKPAANRLFTITKSFAKDLTSSRNLQEEMTNIAKSHVQQVVDFEKSRLGS